MYSGKNNYGYHVSIHGFVFYLSIIYFVGCGICTFHPKPHSSQQPDSNHYLWAGATWWEPWYQRLHQHEQTDHHLCTWPCDHICEFVEAYSYSITIIILHVSWLFCVSVNTLHVGKNQQHGKVERPLGYNRMWWVCLPTLVPHLCLLPSTLVFVSSTLVFNIIYACVYFQEWIICCKLFQNQI